MIKKEIKEMKLRDRTSVNVRQPSKERDWKKERTKNERKTSRKKVKHWRKEKMKELKWKIDQMRDKKGNARHRQKKGLENKKRKKLG